MKRFSGIIAIAVVIIATLAGCNNKPPFVRLAAAVDSCNVAMQQNMPPFATSATVSYDEVTNAVKYEFTVPGEVDKEMFGASAPMLQSQFVDIIAQSNDFNIAGLITEAKSNMLLDFKGSEGGEYEIMVENPTIAAAYQKASEAK